ncbi:MAG: aminotransferase class V-fold PLP-dependent enzyme, partial [bacterium]|nr:aminotransferase class V-fold PLP-dependent enzyme [bacterium]
SESNNTVLKSVSNHFYPEKKKIISTPIEHASVISTLEFLTTQGLQVEYCPVDDKGRLRIDELKKMIDKDTFLICCMLANNEIGTIQNIPKIACLAEQHDVLVLSDCVQALGKIPVDVKELGLDYASFSAHKIHGPKGIGALYVKQGRPFAPFIHGGHQEQGMRAGTESLHNIAGFGIASHDVKELLNHAEKIRTLKHSFVEEIKKIKADCAINSPEDGCLPNTVNITFPNVNNALFMAMLDYNGIAISAGSACNTQDDKPSHVLKRIGLSDRAARETIRVSLSAETSEQDILYAVRIMKEYFENRQTPISMIAPAQLNENILFNENTYIIDIRFWYDRKLLKGLPNSHEASFVSIRKYVNQIPKDKNILVVCQTGYNSPIVAYYLQSKHCKNVSFLLTGLLGWKITQNELYKKYAGKNIEILQPDK